MFVGHYHVKPKTRHFLHSCTVLRQFLSVWSQAPFVTLYSMGSSVAVPPMPAPHSIVSRCQLCVTQPSKRIFSGISSVCLGCCLTNSLSMDISSLPEKVFRVLVDPIGKGYTVDETDVDFNYLRQVSIILASHHFQMLGNMWWVSNWPSKGITQKSVSLRGYPHSINRCWLHANYNHSAF